ncbi:hypothetical protein BCV69DRAFT_297816 [Microstroma glucosiphilum]|uniref:Uncharacterized protein n=1 Tax=Pseudomicrostroma glucosiphilum TaxID=1684307 RepID=A0A316UDW1_9BASI|nr:hypothetical protein BCV69DRAFT_297816 [Pseudomicrostroma glucosiphilum]PWN22531.1 hypothetical protein BCV69DRAFT_297816 [Pseudomicrostroma glucosiphilum]
MASSSSPPAAHPYSSSSSFHAYPHQGGGDLRQGPTPHTASSIASFGTSSAGNHGGSTSAGSVSMSSVPSSGPSTGREGPRELFARRIATFVHLKAVVTGKQLHAGLVQLTRRDMQMIWETEKMKKRTFRHFVLGLALSPVMEMQALPDFARGTLAALNDIEALPESAGGSSGGLTGGAMATLGLGSSTMTGAGEKKGVRNIFSNKLKTSKKGTFSDSYTAGDAFSTSLVPGASNNSTAVGGLTDTLIGGALPFAPDFVHTLITLLDILIEVYAKLLLFVAPTAQQASRSGDLSSNSSVSGHRSHPSVSSMSGFPGASSNRSTLVVPMSATLSTQSQSSSITGAFQGGNSSDAGGGDANVSSRSNHINLSPPMLDIINKIDAKVKKLIVPVIKDLDSLSRHIIKEELTALENGTSRATASPSSSSSRLALPRKQGSAGTGEGSPGPVGLWTGLPQPPPGQQAGGTDEETSPYTPTAPASIPQYPGVGLQLSSRERYG